MSDCGLPANVGSMEGLGPLPLRQKVVLAKALMEEMVRDALHYRWLRDEASAAQWERASHATPGGTDSEVAAMMVCR